jgi:hypothetical protein
MVPLVAALLLLADPGGPAPAARAIEIDGVPILGAAGRVNRQLGSGSEVVLVLDGAEIRISPWPEPGVRPALGGMSLVATVDIHPEGPSCRIELGPEKAPVRWIIGSLVRPPARLVAGASLGRPVIGRSGDPEAPILQHGGEVAHLRAGEATVLRDPKERWCLRILAVAVAPAQGSNLPDDFREPRVDFFARRLRAKTDRCDPIP